VEIEAALRVASQQAAITGSAQPLILALTQAEERLARYSLPRMEQVRRAVARDLEAARRAGGADLGLLSLRLDEALRGVDELPLIAQARAGGLPDAGPRPPSNPPLAEPEALQEGWRAWLARQIRPVLGAVVQEVRGLVRVSRIDQPEALLLSPEQAFFLRENLKLRLLNARLALLSRQFDTVQADLGQADAALQRWFDPDSRRVQQLRETLRQVAAQSRSVELPRPEATLSAIATVTATGR
jgi:uroporphyrin-3 C-methyltransferase